MPDCYVIKDQCASYFLTFQVIAWVDIFTRECYRKIVVDCFNFCVEHKKLDVHAWVIMSNHVHCILSSRNGTLSDTIRDLKRYTARRILEAIQQGQESRKEWMLYQFKRAGWMNARNKTYQFWTHENHAVEIDPFLADMGDSKLIYIHENPVRAGFVFNPEDYLYSSSRDYAGLKGLVNLKMW